MCTQPGKVISVPLCQFHLICFTKSIPHEINALVWLTFALKHQIWAAIMWYLPFSVKTLFFTIHLCHSARVQILKMGLKKVVLKFIISTFHTPSNWVDIWYIVCLFSDIDWGWILGVEAETRPYICEVSKEDIYKINDRNRGPGKNKKRFLEILPHCMSFGVLKNQRKDRAKSQLIFNSQQRFGPTLAPDQVASSKSGNFQNLYMYRCTLNEQTEMTRVIFRNRKTTQHCKRISWPLFVFHAFSLDVFRLRTSYCGRWLDS